jgi:hypothetical protein
MLTQMLLGYYDLQAELYVQTLLGLQLADYFLFALLALVLHALVNHKYVGHLVVLIAYALMTFGAELGLEHNLLIYGSDPGWMYSDMRGFGPFIEAWLWFKAYWATWAVLLAVAGTLLWVRGTETAFRSRLASARCRLSRRVAGMAAATAALVLTLGGFIFYNMNILNAYEAKRAIATQTDAGAWQVSLDVRARKVVVDENGVETELPMDDLIEVGVFAGADGGGLGETLYLQRHRVRSGAQRITITVPRQPARAGIDPRHLLFDVEGEDHVREIGR